MKVKRDGTASLGKVYFLAVRLHQLSASAPFYALILLAL